MERRKESWNRRNAGNKTHSALTASTFDPPDSTSPSDVREFTSQSEAATPSRNTSGVDLETGNIELSPDDTADEFEALPLVNTPLYTPLPQSESNHSLETTTSHFTDARTDFSPPLSRSNATSPLDVSPLSSSPLRPTSTTRSLSSAAIAAIADTPPRPSSRASFSRPPLPPKSSARNSIVDSRRSVASVSSSVDLTGRSRANSSAVGGGDGGEAVVRKVPSFTMSPAPSTITEIPASTLPPSTSSTLSFTSGVVLNPPPLDLNFPRPRPSLPSANSRTPALSQAGSIASSRFSLVSENSSGLRNSEIFQSPDMTDEGTNSIAGSEWSKVKGDQTTPYTTDNEETSASQPAPPAAPALRPPSEPKPFGSALQVDTSSMERHPSPPTGMPPTASLAGLGIGWEEGDLQSNLEELSRYANTLPSPLPSPLPRAEAAESPLDRWQGERKGSVPSSESGPTLRPGDAASSVPPLPPLDPSNPLPSAGTRTRARSASRSRVITKKPSLVDLAASSSSSPYFGGRSGNRSNPPPLPQPQTNHGERTSTQESESYLTMDETDFLSTDDEEGPHSFGKMRFQSFPASADQSVGSSNGGGDYYGVGGTASATHSAGTLSPNGVTNFSNLATIRGNSPDLGSALWKSDLVRVMIDDEDGEKIVHGILDWSGKAIEMREVPITTTHLILARTPTPLLISPLLNVTLPNLSHGLVVLDISSCGLTEVPLAISSCTFLEELDIHGNPLATGTLPSFLGTLPSLFVLIADACGLTSIPSSLSHLSRLHTLAIRDNRLRSLPSWFSRLTSLETLLVEGNPLHWQFQNLVRPLIGNLTDSPEQFDQRRVVSPLPPTLPLHSESLPTSRSRTPSGADDESSNKSLSLPPGLADSPTVASFRHLSPPDLGHFPASAPPQQSTFAELSPGSINERDESPLPSPATIVPSPLRSPPPPTEPPSTASSPAVNGNGREKKTWGRLFKKVSSSRMNSKRPGALEAETRTFSTPVTRAEESQVEEKSGGLFGSRKPFRKKTSRPPVPQALSVRTDSPTPVSNKRRSFLMLDSYKTPSDAGSLRQLPSPTPQNHQVALRSVLAYLRDLDDLSEDLSSPNIALDTSTTPPLRHSPSLGALSPTPPRIDSPDMRRAQSTRRPFTSRSPRPSSSRLSEYYEDSNDSSSGRATPLPGGTFSPLPGSSSSSGPIKTKDDPIRRKAVLEEIVQTEQTYLKGLEELCGIYVASSAKTVSSNGGRKDPVLPVAERRAVFGNIEAIRDFHGTIFLPDLLAAVRAGGDSAVVAARVGEVFRQHGSFLKIYSAYVNGFDASLAQIQTWAASSTSGRPSTASGTSSSSTMFDAASQIGSNLSQSQKKRIKSWMKRCRAHPSHSQISLESYLLLPVQRIPRYRLLLESLLACTPAPTSDSLLPSSAFLDPSSAPLEPHPTIASAVLEMDLVATTLNESKRETEGRAQLLAWQGRIVNRYKSSLVQPHRTLLRSGKLVLTRSVKRSTNHLDPLPVNDRGYYANGAQRSRLGTNGSPNESEMRESEEVHTLFTETSTQELIVLLCTDLLILVKAPPPHLDSDPNSPVELYTVVRLNSGAVEGARKGSLTANNEGPVSLFGKDEDMLRVKVGNKAILYLQHPSASPSSPASTNLSSSQSSTNLNLKNPDDPEVKRKRKMEARQWRDSINLQYFVNS